MLFRFFIFYGLALFTSLSQANSIIADLFDDTLGPHINHGFVHYENIDRAKLIILVDRIASYTIDPTQKQETLAFYLNAYNTLAVKGIVDGYGPHSLLSRYRFFKLNNYIVAGKKIDLYDLEHKIIRPLKEPRIHFALVCAAKSCPPLRKEAYRGEKLDEQLNNQASIFINNKEKNRFNLIEKSAQLSSIFKWFEEDFLLEADSLNQYLAKFIEDKKLKGQLKENNLKISFNKYNWSLNGKR